LEIWRVFVERMGEGGWEKEDSWKGGRAIPKIK
jgi:hypothetical protein